MRQKKKKKKSAFLNFKCAKNSSIFKGFFLCHSQGPLIYLLGQVYTNA